MTLPASISCRFPKSGKFREIVEIARKLLVTTANFLQGLEIVWLFSNMQLTFAWLHCVTYSFVFLLRWHAFCERAVTGQWTTSSCETKFIVKSVETPTSCDHVESWISQCGKFIALPSFPQTLQSTMGVLPPSMNHILPPSMSHILPLSMSCILPPLMNCILPWWMASSLH